MKTYQCTICGGVQSIPDGVIELECEYCGNRQIVNKAKKEAVLEKKKTNKKLQCTLLALLQERIRKKRILMWTVIALLLAVMICFPFALIVGYFAVRPGRSIDLILGATGSLVILCAIAFSVFKFKRMIKMDLAVFEKYKDPFQNVYKADKQLKERY